MVRKTIVMVPIIMVARALKTRVLMAVSVDTSL